MSGTYRARCLDSSEPAHQTADQAADQAAERLRILPTAVSNTQRPRHAQWESLFCLQDGPALPLQQRLRLSVVQAILDGRLPMGAPLPSSRELAKVLGLSRNTVTAAYVQ